ncbi:MAG: M56 family metallopeptidase, partial [Phycisphaerae bacterium]
MFWQVGLLVMLVAVLDKFVRRGHHPHIRLTLWSLVLLKLVIPPAWALETSLTSILFGAEAVPVLVHDAADLIHSASDDPQRSFGAAAAQVLSLRNPGAGSSLANLLTWTLMGVWLCGAVFFGTLLVRRIRSFSASLRATGKAAPVHLQDLAEEASKRIGLKSTPEVVIGDALHSAAVMGLRRPF